eukprot:2139461-Alexandrium_andersonii.AAC.1
MKLYTNSKHKYFNTHEIIKNTRTFAYTPATLNTIVAGAGIVLSNGAYISTITATITSLSDYYTRTQTDLFSVDYYDKTCIDALASTTSHVGLMNEKPH